MLDIAKALAISTLVFVGFAFAAILVFFLWPIVIFAAVASVAWFLIQILKDDGEEDQTDRKE